MMMMVMVMVMVMTLVARMVAPGGVDHILVLCFQHIGDDTSPLEKSAILQLLQLHQHGRLSK